MPGLSVAAPLFESVPLEGARSERMQVSTRACLRMAAEDTTAYNTFADTLPRYPENSPSRFQSGGFATGRTRTLIVLEEK